MSDIEQPAPDVADSTTPTLIEAAPPSEPGKASEPRLELVPSSPPSEPRVQTLENVAHTRIGGSAGVRVQQLGGVTVQRAGAGDPLDATSLRVSRSTFRELELLLAAFPGDELGDQVAALFVDQLKAER